MKEAIKDKRAAALQATLELIAEQGFQGTPMSQIAQRANIGVGTIYRYFTNKDDLINALYLETQTRRLRYILRNYSENMPVEEGIKQLIINAIHYYTENPAELSFLEQYENSPLITSDTRKEGAQISISVINLLNRAREQNILKELPKDLLAALLSGTTISLAKLYLSGRVKFDESLLVSSIDAIWDMIKR